MMEKEVVKPNSSPTADNDRRKIEMILGLKPSGKLLDVGCAMGEFLGQAHLHGYDVQGVELAECAAARAREMYGVNVHTGDLV